MAPLPYVTSPGNIPKALNEIKKAAVPERVSQDFVKTVLKIPGGSGTQIATFLKKINLVNPDGSPSEKYRKFRNPVSSGSAIADAIKYAYAPLYVRNEYMHELNEKDLIGLVVEETGQASDAAPVKLIVSCIKYLKGFANFETRNVEIDIDRSQFSVGHKAVESNSSESHEIGLNLSYTINLNLPATTDSAVFDAIFRSLKQNLLRRDDA